MGTQRGQPKTTFFIRFCIAYKVIQYKRRYNLTPFKAWLKLTKHKAFEDLMKEHFKNKSYPEHWINSIQESDDVKKNFYKNHIRKIIAEFPTIKIATPKEYKEYLAKIKARKLSGIGSLKNILNRPSKH